MKRVLLSALVAAAAFCASAEESTPPAAIAPAWREFAAKCDAKEATRADLIAFKRFVAASKVSEEDKAKWTAAARSRAQSAWRKPKTKGKTK